ncbi:hypothetical protein [Actinoplanes sp. NPDC026623]|uniref:hypothetical protein n=1 Tax=Actinoplanes sp. NPDC026623 TaxID=3155610 RepID=UPI0033C294E9
MTYPLDPADQRLTDFMPPGVVAAQQRALEDAADLQIWRAHDAQWRNFHRLRQFSVNHATQAWRRRYRSPLAPYALAYLFTQPIIGAAGSSSIAEVRAATRLWKAGAESQHPIPLLAALSEQSRGRDPRLIWDLRTELANRSDDGMADDAVYIGLGLSSLDTPTGTWDQVCRQATSELDIAGTILYTSTGSEDPADQQVIVADRRGAFDVNVTTIHTYRGLGRYQRSSPYPFSNVQLHHLYEDSGHGPLLWAMRELDLVLHEADRQRRMAASGRREHRRRPS